MSKKFYGKYRGQVADNQDPKKLGRLKLRVPEVIGEVVTDWASPCVSPLGGIMDVGLFMVPDIDSGVWVEFEAGDINRPIWVGVWWSEPGGKSEVPDLAQGIGDESTKAPKGTDVCVAGDGSSHSEPVSPFAAQYPHNKVVKTKNGLIIELDDTVGKERVQIWHPKGAYIEISPEGCVGQRVQGDKYEVIEGESVVHTKGAQHVVTGENATLACAGSVHQTVFGNVDKSEGGMESKTVVLNVSVTVLGNYWLKSNSIMLGFVPIGGVVTDKTWPVCPFTGAPIVGSVSVRAQS